jgi:hypothetical protein
MTAQIEARMPSNSSVSGTNLQSGVTLTVCASIAISLCFAIIYIINRSIQPAVLVSTSAAGLGLVSGFFSRWSLLKRGHLMRWLVAVVGLCAGLVFLGWLSAGLLGIDIFSRSRDLPDWNGLSQILLGVVSSWLAIRAWGGRSISHWGTLNRVRLTVLSLRNSINARLHPRTVVDASTAATPSVVMPSSHRPVEHRPTARTPVRQRATKVRVRQKARRARSSVHLSETVEHSCPFCLGTVDPNNVKGFKECPICHTLHHVDCWAVTGTCQVPHHHK